MRNNRIRLLAALAICIIVIVTLYMLMKGNTTSIDQIEIVTDLSGSAKLFFGHINPENRDYSLSYFDLETEDIHSQGNLGNMFARKIFLNPNDKTLWIPIEYEKNLKVVSNKIKVIHLDTGIVKEVEAGVTAKDIQFMGDRIAVTCLDTGLRDLKTYIIDKDTLSIVDTIMLGGDTCESGVYDSESARLFIVSEDLDNRISKLFVIDVETGELIKTLDFPNIPLHGSCIIDKRIWLVGGNTLFLINLNDYSTEKTIELSNIAYQIIKCDEYAIISHIYPLMSQEEGISVINTSTLNIEKINLDGILPASIMVYNDNLLIVDTMSGLVHEYNLTDRVFVNSILIGKFPTNIVVFE